MDWEKENSYYIGIDPGTKTGLAIWSNKYQHFTRLSTLKIYEAIKAIESFMQNQPYTKLLIIVEDARQVKYFGRSKQSQAQAQGAGSVKRDCNIWEEVLMELGKHYPFYYQFKRPSKQLSKIDKKRFEQITGVKTSTSQHARDAAMLVYNL